MPHDNNELQAFNHGAPAGFSQGHHRAPSIQVHGGGVVRVQHGIPDAAQPMAPPPEQHRVHYGPIRVSMAAGGGEVTNAGPTRHLHNPAGTAGGSVMSTLQPGVNPSVCRIPGDESTRISLAVAERDFGLIVRDAGGRYIDKAPATAPTAAAAAAGNAGAESEQPTPPEGGPDLSLGAVDAEEEALWAEDIADMSQPSFDGATASAVGFLAHGTGSVEAIADSLARNEGMAPQLAAEYVTEGIAMGQRIVDRALEPLGLTGDKLAAFYEAVKQQPAKLQDAIQRVAHARDVTGFTALAAEFKARTADLSVWRANGFQAAVDPQTGDVLVQRGSGPWVKAQDIN